MTFKLALLDDYQGVAVASAPWHDLPGLEVTGFGEHIDEAAGLIDRLQPFDAVMVMRERTPFPRDVLDRLPKLRLLVTTGPSNDSIDVAAAAELGIIVCGTGGAGSAGARPSAATAELTWGLILSLVRQIPMEDASIRSGGWQRSVGTELGGGILGVIGLGRVGRQVADIGRAFGMHVLAWSSNLTSEAAAASGAEHAPLASLLERSRVATIHLKLSPRTRGLIGEDELRTLGADSFLVNTSRGAIVDESALVRALHDGWIAGAGLDVFAAEPLRPDHALRFAPRTVLTPHLGYVTDSAYETFYAHAFEDVRAFLAGHPVRVISA